MEKEKGSRVKVVVIVVVILALIGSVTAYIAHQNSVERERIAKEKAKAAQKAEEEKSKKICESLSGKNFTCKAIEGGYDYCDFLDSEKLYTYGSDLDNGKSSNISEYFYKVKKLKDKYVIYTDIIEDITEEAGYEFVVTKIDSEQITEFVRTEDYLSDSSEVFALGKGEKESKFSDYDFEIARSLFGNSFKNTKVKKENSLKNSFIFDTAFRCETMLAWGQCRSLFDEDGKQNNIDDCGYGIKKIGKDKYVIDINKSSPDNAIDSPLLLFEDGYDYIVTKIEDSQIVEFEDSKGKNPNVYRNVKYIED